MLNISPEGLIWGGLAATALGYLVRLFFRAWLASNPSGRQQGQVLADLLEAAEPLVLQAEALQVPGAAKAARVRAQLEGILFENGIQGDARRVAEHYIPGIIEMAVARCLKGEQPKP